MAHRYCNEEQATTVTSSILSIIILFIHYTFTLFCTSLLVLNKSILDIFHRV
jgi:hypothetical protein